MKNIRFVPKDHGSGPKGGKSKFKLTTKLYIERGKKERTRTTNKPSGNNQNLSAKPVKKTK